MPDLTLDLAGGALGEFRLGAPAELLKQRLGPPASWNSLRRSGHWLYPELGAVFESTNGKIDGLSVITRRPESSFFKDYLASWQPWSGVIRFPDKRRASGKDTRLAAFLEHAGKPAAREQEEQNVLLQYSGSPRFPYLAFDAEFTLQGELISICLWPV